MKCPVCGLDEVSPEAKECPQCNTDLACFTVLDSITDTVFQARQPPVKKKGLRFIALLAGATFLLVLASYQLYRLNKLDSEFKSQLSGLSSTFAQKMDALSGSLKKESVVDQEEAIAKQSPRPLLKAPRNAPTSEKYDFFVYRAKAADTLWDISEAFYRSGVFYPVIIEMNPGLNIYRIGDGVTINILKDLERVKEIYSAIVTKKGPLVFYHYKLSRGETVDTVAAKFYKGKTGPGLLRKLNPYSGFKTGERVHILLN